jgi:hypothetical protein
MILSTEQQAQLEQAIVQKFGRDAIKNPRDRIDRLRRKEITEEYLEARERWDNYDFKEEITEEESVVIIDKKANKSEPHKACEKCGKESVVFSSRDYFFAYKHSCCEECFYLYYQ